MAKTSSKHKKELYTVYKTQNRFATNRKRKLLKLQKAHPNNEQITLALANISYRRKKPGTSLFSKTKIRALQIAKSAKTGPSFPRPSVVKMFSLATRAHTKEGEFLWLNS